MVEKFIGDAVVGVFGAPTAFGDDAERAVHAALAVRDTAAAMDAADPRLDLKVRIAVNTGEALVTLDARPALGEAMTAGDVINTALAPPVGGAGRKRAGRRGDAASDERGDPVCARPGGCGEGEAAAGACLGRALRGAWGPGERSLAGPLVGRDHELEVLRGDVGTGSGRAHAAPRDRDRPRPVSARRGWPSSLRLFVEDRGGRTVAPGEPFPYRESTAYAALAFQLKQLCGIFETDSVEVARTKLEQTVSTLLPPAEATSVTEHLGILLGLDSSGTIADRENLFFSIRSFIEAMAREGPMMLVFEDLHWADEALLNLVERLAARLQDLPILVVVLARPDSSTRVRAGEAGYLPTSALTLRPLAETDATELAVHRLADLGAKDSANRATDLAVLAGGNPLFIEQLAAVHAETGEAPTSLPTTIRGIIAARLDALPAVEREVVLDAAVSGRVFWRGALERMMADPQALTAVLAELERRGLVTEETVSAFEGHQQYSFNHVLVRDVAYDLLPRARRRDRHREAALFLEEVSGEFGEVGAVLARHWRDAGDHSRAVDYFVAAGADAERGWAKEHAAALYREALQLVPESDAERRREITRRLALAKAASVHVLDAQTAPARRVGDRLGREVAGRDVACDLVDAVHGRAGRAASSARGRSS